MLTCHPAMAEIGYERSLAANCFLHITVIREPSGWERALRPAAGMRGAEGFAFENQPRWIPWQRTALMLRTLTTVALLYGAPMAAGWRPLFELSTATKEIELSMEKYTLGMGC